MTKRPNLAAAVKASAQGAMAPADAPPAAEPHEGTPRPKAARSASRVGKKAAYAWLDPADHRRLRRMSLETDRSIDELVGSAVLEMLDKAGYSR